MTLSPPIEDPAREVTITLRLDEAQSAHRALRNIAEVLLQTYAEKVRLNRVAEKLAASYEIKRSDEEQQ